MPDGWSIDGVTSARDEHRGGCVDEAAVGGEAVYVFTAPATASWRFDAGPDADVYLRETCADPGSEIACDAGGVVVTQLDDGQTIYVFVDNRDSLDPTEFTLSATRQPSAPALVTVEAYYNPQTTLFAMRAVGTDPDDDVVGFSLAALDDEGMVIDHPFAEMFAFQNIEAGEGDFTGEFVFPFDSDLQALDIAAVRVAVADAEGQWSDPVDVELGPPPEAEVGAECDVAASFARCPEGSACLDRDGEGRVCAVATEPVLTGGAFYLDAETRSFGVVAEGDDAEDDVLALDLLFLDAEGDEVETADGGGAATVFPAWVQQQGGHFIAAYAAEFDADFDDFDRIAAVRVWVLDQALLSSESMDFESAEAPALEAADRCVPPDAIGACPEGHACIDRAPAPGSTSTCVVATPPTLVSGAFFLNPETRDIGLRLEGMDAEEDVSAIEFVVLDGDGAEIELLEDGGALRVQPARVAHADGAYVATFAGAFDGGFDEFDQIAAARVWAVDKGELLSETMVFDAAPPPALVAGDDCEFSGSLGLCAMELACFSLDADDANGVPPQSLCQAPVAACPESWNVGDLGANGRDGVWSVEGDAGRDRRVGPGSCGGGAPADLHAFTAPAAGTYHFEIDGVAEGGDTLMYARSHCAIRGPVYELVCNDDDGGLTSAFDLDLAAAQTVYLVVDAYIDPQTIPYGGPYTLTVTAE